MVYLLEPTQSEIARLAELLWVSVPPLLVGQDKLTIGKALQPE